MGVKQHADRGGKLRLDQLLGHSGKWHRIAQTRRNAQQAFRYLEQPGQASAAAGDHAARAERTEYAALAQILAQQLEELAGARLKNLAQLSAA